MSVENWKNDEFHKYKPINHIRAFRVHFHCLIISKSFDHTNKLQYRYDHYR